MGGIEGAIYATEEDATRAETFTSTESRPSCESGEGESGKGGEEDGGVAQNE
jgi:hypothetical protein